MYLYYLELQQKFLKRRELHQANCWYFLKQKLSNYSCVGAFKDYGSALQVLHFQGNMWVKTCPFCSESNSPDK